MLMQKREGILLEETLKSWLIYVAKNKVVINVSIIKLEQIVK